MKAPEITLTEMDYFRLNNLVDHMENYEKTLEDLEEELERARIVDFPEIATDLVTMNTRFRYLNVTDNKESEMTVVYPEQSNTEERWVSVTAPLGAALLGLREGDEIDWTFPDGKVKTLRILEIVYQPEANKDLHM